MSVETSSRKGFSRKRLPPATTGGDKGPQNGSKNETTSFSRLHPATSEVVAGWRAEVGAHHISVWYRPIWELVIKPFEVGARYRPMCSRPAKSERERKDVRMREREPHERERVVSRNVAAVLEPRALRFRDAFCRAVG